MKTKRLVTLLSSLFLVSGLTLASCETPTPQSPTDNPSDSSGKVESPSNSDVSSPSTSVDDVVTYYVTFKDGETVIASTSGKSGDFVDIPDDLVSSDSRYQFVGWDGLDPQDYEAGKVEIFSSDVVYQARWHEQFGTDTTFTATRVHSSHNISVDGTMDPAYADATEIPVNTVTAGTTDTTAKVYLMWDETYFYVFADVKDSTVIGRDYSYDGGQWTEHNDTFEIWIDLLHDESLASPTWNGGWGGGYRGEPGPMCEAHFKINAGYDPANSRFGAGSEACWDGWWSNECGNDGESVGISKITDTGYTVEYKIKATHGNIPEDLRLAAGEQIGVGVKIYDKTVADAEGDSKENPAPNAVAMEAINGNMSGPKKLSNVNVVANANENKTILNVKEVRDCFDVVVDNEEDLLYKDASTTQFGSSTVKMLWNEEKVYVLAALGETAEYLKVSSPLLGDEVEITSGVTEFAIPSTMAFTEGSTADFNVSYKEQSADEVSTEYLLKLIANENNFASARHLFEAKKLAEDATITVDGVRDSAYDGTQEISISTIALLENGATADQITTRGKAWIRWSDEYIYVFVDVTDSSVNAVTVGDPWNNDSVEFWLSTCQSLPQANTGWGDANRPSPDWCGEGGWRVWANEIGGLSGSHWMYDWADGVQREIKSILTDTGYTVEYKIQFSAFAGVKDKTGQVIDFMININEGANGTRSGIVSTNEGGQNAWDKPYNLDHLKLVD